MNSEGLVPSSISDLLEKLNEQLKKFALKETEWLMQKYNYETKISELEGLVKANENINIDLFKRVKMLEYALAQERQKYFKLASEAGIKIDNTEMKFMDNKLTYDVEDRRELIKEEDLKILKEKSVRPSLIKMLNDIGINENLANELFTDLELNRAELENLIKTNINERASLSEIIPEPSPINKALIGIKKNNQFSASASVSASAQPSNNEVSGGPIANKINNLNQGQINIEEINYIRPEAAGPSTEIVPNINLLQSKPIDLKSHFDVVRKVGYMSNLNTLVSVSEDCLIKLWNLKNLNYSNTNVDIEPYLCLRGHNGPLFSLAIGNETQNMIFTAGNEGLIKVWKVPPVEEIVPFGDAENTMKYHLGTMHNKSDCNDLVIWDLLHHPSHNLLVSLTSDANINLWKSLTPEEYISSSNEGKFDKGYLGSKSRKTDNHETKPNPTTCTFMNTDLNSLAVGYNDSYISLYSITKEKFFMNLKTNNLDIMKHNPILMQPNCILSNTSAPILYAGFEDNYIRIFDTKIENSVISYNAHNDAVTSLNILNDVYLFSTSHDSKIKMWDLRNFNTCVQEVLGSQRKFDEAMWHSCLIQNQLLLATACADCSIKIFKL